MNKIHRAGFAIGIISLLLFFAVNAHFAPIQAAAVSINKEEKCPFEQFGLPEVQDRGLPEHLVRNYVLAKCNLHQGIAKAINGETTVEWIISAQIDFDSMNDQVNSYYGGYMPEEPSSASDINKWIDAVRQANVVPAALHVESRTCTYSTETCLYVSNDKFSGVIVSEGWAFHQSYPNFSVTRKCDKEITQNNIRDAWNCQITFVTFLEQGKWVRGMTGLALTNY